MEYLKNSARLTTVVVAALMAMGCKDTPTSTADVLGAGSTEISMIRNTTLAQVDRFGLPAVNTAFTDTDALKNQFNTSAPVNDAQFIDDLVAVIMARYGLNEANATGLAEFVLPDVQPLGDLSGFPNGRRLTDDVIDVELSLIFGDPAASDGVDGNDEPFLNVFPYLADPNLP